MLDTPSLLHIAPSCKHPEVWVPLLNQYMPKYEINTNQRIAAFIAQISHESASFNATEEFASGQAYEGRNDLGNTSPGDGVKYKGRGLVQITGRAMYKTCGDALGLDLINHPELLEQPPAATESACWFWQKIKGLNEIADKPEDWTRTSKKTGKTYTKFEWITKLINGGLTNYSDRLAFYNRAKEVFPI